MSLFEAPIVNVVRVTANPGKEDALRALILKSAGNALASPGNTGFQVHVSQDDPAEFLIIEHWDSRSEHLKHMRDPAMPRMLEEVKKNDLIKTGPEDTEWTQLT